MRPFLTMSALAILLHGGLPARAQPPHELKDMQGKYQAALQNIARTYEEQIEDLNAKYLAALQRLEQQFEARGDEAAVRLIEAEIDWVQESRDQIPHPWELLDAASEQVISPGDEPTGMSSREPDKAAAGTLTLGPFWNRSTRTGKTAQKDLGRLFEGHAEPGVNLEGAPGLSIYQGVTYLMPVDQAIEALGGEPDGNERQLVETPGLPERSFYYHTSTGEFEGRFDTARLVTDLDDQVVAVQFAGEPRSDDPSTFYGKLSKDWRMYDLVLNRRKAASDWYVGHLITASEEVLQIDTITCDGRPSAWSTRYHHRSRLYLPRRIVSLILDRVAE